MAINVMRMCERFHFTPAELEEIPNQTIEDWITIMRYEEELKKDG